MGSYNREKSGGFQNDSSIKSVLYGAAAIVLEDELNEAQWNQIENIAEFIRLHYSSGILNKDYDIISIEYENTFYVQTKNGKPLSLILDGYLLDIANNTPDNLNGIIEPSDDKLIIKLSATGEEIRTDLVYLEAWFEVISYYDELRKFGGVDTPLLANTMLDDRIKEETARRVQLRWRLSSLEGQTNLEGVMANGYDGGTSDIVIYSKQDNLYVANFGEQHILEGSSLVQSIKTDGKVYAIPLFSVKRKILNDTIDVSDISDIIPRALPVNQKYIEEVGEGQIDSSGQTRINLSSEFLDCVDNSISNYIVSIQGIDDNNFIVPTRNSDNFIVEGTIDGKFMYRVIGTKK